MIACARLWPDPAPGNNWAHWVVIAEKLGAVFPLRRAFLLCIRNVEPWATQTHPLEIVPRYNDTGVLLSANPQIPPAVFAMSSHAYQWNSRASPDIDGDGKGDVGTIKPGRFVAHLRADKYPVFELTLPDGNKNLPCLRDVTHMGKPEAESTADSILIHWGYNAPADSTHSSSIGCWTMDGPELNLLKSEAAKADGAVDCCLELAENVLKLVPDESPKWDDETEPQA